MTSEITDYGSIYEKVYGLKELVDFIIEKLQQYNATPDEWDRFIALRETIEG